MGDPAALPTARTAAEAATADRLREYMTSAKAGTVKPKPWSRPASPLLDAIEQRMGIAPAPAAPVSDDPDSDIREEAYARLTREQKEGCIKRDPAAEAEYTRVHAEVTAEYAAAAEAEADEYMHSPTGGAQRNAEKLWAESRGR